MSPASRRAAGILLIVMPTVIFGGVSLLSLLMNDPAYMQNPLRQNLFRAGHAHAGGIVDLIPYRASSLTNSFGTYKVAPEYKKRIMYYTFLYLHFLSF